MNIVSLFDGMACGMLAMQGAGVKVDNYWAYEIDKYAIQTATHNFPEIKECGDVFDADFKKYEDIDFLIGGSPCTFWSIAQKNNRETEASGMGWELFSQYVRALRDIKPKYFIYENNKSMSKAIRQSITESFGFDAICINSALVSAQNRQRLYWVGKRNDDGTYSKVNIEQPEDRGMDLTSNNKAYTLTASYNGAVAWNTIERNQRNMVAEPVGETKECKSYCLTAGYANGSGENIGNYAAHTLTKGCKSMVAEPIPTTITGTVSDARNKTGLYDVHIEFQELKIRNNAHIAINENAIRGVQDKNNASCAECFYEFTDRKANTLTTAHTPKIIDDLSNYKGLTTPCEWNANGIPTKAISGADGKTYTVYAVIDGQITIKGKTYPIKLSDGYYIIRKLTVSECKRLQTVPEWYEFPVSSSQSYKLLGNGWTVDVIVHLIKGCLSA